MYRVAFDAGADYPHRLELKASGSSLFQQYGCRACHALDDAGGTSGPDLDRPALERRIQDRLASPEYAQRVEEIARLEQEPFVSYADERQRVLAAEGREQVKLWLEYRLLEPRFDDPGATIPKVGVTPGQAGAIADYLLTGEFEGAPPPKVAFSDRVRNTLESKRFAAGIVAGVGFAAATFALLWLVRRRTNQRPRTSP
ncbi:MAG: c-type cytochrome [Gaiellaceae bacterium MAG52_C11]|nr:c-type cytochrome [Candidatus Gaiellasilicea maunaloa]